MQCVSWENAVVSLLNSAVKIDEVFTNVIQVWWIQGHTNLWIFYSGTKEFCLLPDGVVI